MTNVVQLLETQVHFSSRNSDKQKSQCFYNLLKNYAWNKSTNCTYLLHDHILTLSDERVFRSDDCLQKLQILNVFAMRLDAVHKMLDYFLTHFIAQGGIILENRTNSLSLTNLKKSKSRLEVPAVFNHIMTETKYTTLTLRHVVAQLVEAPRHKPEGRWFDSRWRHWNFSSI